MADALLHRADAALQEYRSSGDVSTTVLLVTILEMLIETHFTTGASLSHIERMEQKIMADESRLSADFGQMSSDLDEIQTSVQALQQAQATGNDTAVQAEIDKLVGLVDPLAAKARGVAQQFDPNTPPTPAPAPAASKR